MRAEPERSADRKAFRERTIAQGSGRYQDSGGGSRTPAKPPGGADYAPSRARDRAIRVARAMMVSWGFTRVELGKTLASDT